MTRRRSSKKIARVVVLLSLVAGGSFAYLRSQKKAAVEPHTYYGNVDVRDVTLSFRVGGRVESVHKNEGDHVEVGELLASLDKAPYRLALDQARAALDVANAQLKNVEAGARREDISQARAVLSERKAAYDRAKDTYDRTARLEKTGAATTQSLVDAKAMAEQTKAGVDAAQATVSKLVNGARSEELLVAHAQASQAQAAVATLELNLQDAELRAMQSGVVVTRAIEPGTMVQPGSPAMVVAIEDPVWVRGFASEEELASLSPGTPVAVYVDSRPQPYLGQVGYVSPQAEFTPKNVETTELRSSLVYRFRVVVKKHDGGLRQGMPVTIKLSKKNVAGAPGS